MKHSWITIKGKQKCEVCGAVATHKEPHPQTKYTGCLGNKKFEV